MLRALRRRLDVLWAEHRREIDAEAAERDRRGARELFVTMLRNGLTRAGIDPAAVPAMRRYDEPEPQPLPTAASAIPRPSDDPRAILYERLSRLARRFRAQPLDLRVATPMELFAVYCFDPAEATAHPAAVT